MIIEDGVAGGLGWWLRRSVQLIIRRRADPPLTLFQGRLPSKLPQAQFQVVIQAEWPTGWRVDPVRRSLVEQHLLAAARSAAEHYSVLDPGEAGAAMDLELSSQVDMQDAGIHPTTACITQIEVGQDDRRMAESQEAFCRQTALTQIEQMEDARRLRILSDEILIDPTLARLWWLDGKPERLAELVAQGKMFEEVSDLFCRSPEPLAAEPIAELIRIFLKDLDVGCREWLVGQLHRVFGSFERGDLADKLDSYRQSHAVPNGQHLSVGAHSDTPDL